MSSFHVELKKVVDDTYDVEIGSGLGQTLIDDLKGSLDGGIKKARCHNRFPCRRVIRRTCMPGIM